MSRQAALDFLERYGMSPALIEPARDAAAMAEEMERGLRGEPSSFPMIPTYLSDEGEIPLKNTFVIPKPFDPRVVPHVARKVAEAAIASGVAQLTIDDFDAYEKAVARRIAASRAE